MWGDLAEDQDTHVIQCTSGWVSSTAVRLLLIGNPLYTAFRLVLAPSVMVLICLVKIAEAHRSIIKSSMRQATNKQISRRLEIHHMRFQETVWICIPF